MSNQSINISPATRYQNAALNYYLGLTNSPYLHYGYWESLPSQDQELTIGMLKMAQEAYTAKLMNFIPRGTRTVLDVGCGTGGNAAYLLERGFIVEGLAPDPFQQEKFLQSTQGMALFHLTQFETFKATHLYDLILLSESSQYMSAKDIANCAARLLDAGGYLLLADMMRSDPNYKRGMFSNCHLVTDLEEALVSAGFTRVKSEDISVGIVPTLDLCVQNFRRFGLSTIIYLGDLLEIAVPPLHKLVRWAFRRWLKDLVVEGLKAREIFEKHLCYQMQLWQVDNSKSL